MSPSALLGAALLAGGDLMQHRAGCRRHFDLELVAHQPPQQPGDFIRGDRIGGPGALACRPEQKLAQLSIARIAQRFEMRGISGAFVRARRCRNIRRVHIARQLLDHGDGGILRAYLFQQRPGLPVCTQLEAIQGEDDREQLTSGTVILAVRKHMNSQGIDHAIDQAVEGSAHAAASSARSNARTIEAIWLAITAMRMSLKRSTSKARTAHIWMAAAWYRAKAS